MSTDARVRAFLESSAKRRILFTYQELAKALDILPPYSIHQVSEALERLMEEDAERTARSSDGQDARTFHAVELNAVFARWAVPATTTDEDTLFSDTNPTLTRGGGLCSPPFTTT